MPDTRTHRGPHSDDPELFGAEALPRLNQAARDLNWLLDRGYAQASSLTLVGNRYNLSQRQRIALGRSCCTTAQLELRKGREVAPLAVSGAPVWIDAYNQLITVESALGGGVLVKGRDSCIRDLASLHGTYRRVEETATALSTIGRWLAERRPARVHWIIDRPVSNSGRLAAEIRALADENGWAWEVALEFSPDAVLVKADGVILTHDSVILDRCMQWANGSRCVINAAVPKAWVVDLSSSADPH